MSRRQVGATVLGVTGEVLVTVGLLLGLFVVWQLWWTDVEVAQRQADVVAALGWDDDVAPGPAPDGDPGEPPVLGEPEPLETFALLHVPRWGDGYRQIITEGVGKPEVLDRLGIGHYPGTAMPGGIGNVALAGHRVTYGKPFNRVEELRVGDPLVVRTEDAWYVYRVTATAVVLPHEVDVIAPDPADPGAEPSERMMTLTTCHPMFSARERFVVHSTLERWQPVRAGAPIELEEA